MTSNPTRPRPDGIARRLAARVADRLRGVRRVAMGAALVAFAGCATTGAAGPGDPDPGPAAEIPAEAAAATDTIRGGAPAAVQPGAPGQGTRTLDATEQRRIPDLAHTEADVRFMQNMILHHAQALLLASLVPDRAESPSIRLLADRIDRSQHDEIALMSRWLEARGEAVPDWRPTAETIPGADPEHAAHHDPDEHAAHRSGEDRPPGGHEMMAGMLTPEQLGRLAAAEGEAFDRLFLQSMIHHHDGALQMVDELFSMPGAAQEPEIFQFASHVGSDQRIEIARMERMLRSERP